MSGFTPHAGVSAPALGILNGRGMSLLQSSGDEMLQEIFIWTMGLMYLPEAISFLDIDVLWFCIIALMIALVLSLVFVFILLKKSTGRLETNKLLQKSSEKLKAVNENKNRFISIVSHDIRSPLNTISGISDLLQMEAGSLSETEIKKYTNTIQDQVLRIRHLVNNMLDANKIELGDVKLNPEPVNIKDLVSRVSDSLAIYAGNKKVSISSEIDLESEEIISDRHALYSIIENLLSNAIKFSPPESNVHLKVTGEKNKTKIVIRDEGPGFTENDKKKLFKKFSRLSANPTANEKTTGLGLYIVKNMVEELNGEIELHSKPDNGSAFSVFLNKA